MLFWVFYFLKEHVILKITFGENDLCCKFLTRADFFADTWNVSVQGSQTRCSGVLISDRHVLVGSDCLPSPSSGEPSRDLKATFLNRNAVNVVKVESGNDDLRSVTILTLDRALNFSDSAVMIRPACLPQRGVSLGGLTTCQGLPSDNSDPLFCISGTCSSSSSVTLTSKLRNGRQAVLGIRQRRCFINSQVPYVDIAALSDKIEQIIQPLEQPALPLPTGANLDAQDQVFPKICPHVFKTDNGLDCVFGRRPFDGRVSARELSGCRQPKVFKDGIQCAAEQQPHIDILCNVLPDNSTTVTLKEANQVCWDRYQRNRVSSSSTDFPNDDDESDLDAQPSEILRSQVPVIVATGVAPPGQFVLSENIPFQANHPQLFIQRPGFETVPTVPPNLETKLPVSPTTRTQFSDSTTLDQSESETEATTTFTTSNTEEIFDSTQVAVESCKYFILCSRW